MWRHIASNALTFMLLAMFLLGGVILWGKAQYEAEGPLSDAICVEVPRGTNFDRVSRSLVDQGAVTSGPILRIGAKYAEKTEQLKAGSFLVEPGASMEQIVDVVGHTVSRRCGRGCDQLAGDRRVAQHGCAGGRGAGCACRGVVGPR